MMGSPHKDAASLELSGAWETELGIRSFGKRHNNLHLPSRVRNRIQFCVIRTQRHSDVWKTELGTRSFEKRHNNLHSPSRVENTIQFLFI